MGDWKKYKRGGRICAVKTCTTPLSKRYRGNVCRGCIRKIQKDNGIK